MDPFELLKTDHRKVEQLFSQLESASGKRKLDVFKQIKTELDNCKLVSSFHPGSDALIESTCTALGAGSLVGWFQGRCEFGHRALGFRSILANPFTPYIGENINRFLKHRESFHPFVISVPQESACDYFHRVGPNARAIASVT